METDVQIYVFWTDFIEFALTEREDSYLQFEKRNPGSEDEEITETIFLSESDLKKYSKAHAKELGFTLDIEDIKENDY